MSEPLAAPEAVPSGPTPPATPPRSPYRPWLAAILASLVLILASLVALDGIIWVRTAPAPVPTGPDHTVSIQVRTQGLVVNASLIDPTGSAVVSLPDRSAQASVTWQRVLAYGERVDVRVVATSEYNDDEDSMTDPKVTCRITDEQNKVLVQNTGSGEHGTAECSWTNS